MKTQIDLKSVLLGVSLGVLTMFALGAGTSPNETGRYQVSSGQTTAVIVDSKTGQAWAFSPVNTGQYRSDPEFWNVK
ncbi:MAG: hypothetical protein WCS42_16880 [Verrucomicrobiota bacterium]